MVVIFCYLASENYTVLKFHVNSSSYFEVSAPLFQVTLSNKRCALKYRNSISAGGTD